MSVSINTAKLSNVFGLLAKATDHRSSVPVLGNVLFNFCQNSLNMFATDLNILVTTSMEVVNENQGESEAITLPAKIFHEIIATMKEDVCLTIRKDGSGVSFSDGVFNGSLHGIPATEFPPVDIALKGDNFSLGRSLMMRVVDQVGICASKDGARPALNGVLFEIKDKKLNCVATDGCMVAVMECPDCIVDVADQNIIMPASSLKVVYAALKLFQPDDISIWKSDAFGVFSMIDCTIRSDLIEGNYPEYTGVIPKSFKTKISLKKLPLLMAVKQVLALGLENPSMVFLSEKGELKTYSPESASEEISSSQQLEAEFDGPDVRMSLNPKFLKAILEQITGEDVVLHVNQHNTPVKMSFPGDPNLFYIIMPMFLN